MPPLAVLFDFFFVNMQHDLNLSSAVIIASFLLSVILTGFARAFLLRRSVLDIPNDRSSHKMPVPRGAGWALMIIFIPALVGAAYAFDHDFRRAGLIAAVALLAVFSGIDDRKPLSPALRLGAHLVAAFLGSLAFARYQTLFGNAVPFWLDRALMILAWAWFMNLYNFMDGIDGLTGAETVFIAAGWGVVASIGGVADPFTDFLTLVLAGASLGFLAHNWHPAKIFLGDVGSVPLGFLTGYCLLVLAMKGLWLAALILPLYYLADSGITIAKRAFRLQPVWKAHREHFYQKAALGAGSHAPVVVFVIVADIGLICAAALSVAHPWAGLGAGVLIVAVLLGKLHRLSIPKE